MYKLLSIFILIAILFLILNHCRKRKIICRVRCMSLAEKCSLLNELAEPFGFCYDYRQDLFSTRTDAWQKDFGYGKLYDLAAPSMNMVLDTEPVYFNYQKKTWLIQFWKGQYGITAGAEMGIYHADTVIPPVLRGQTIFQAAEENEMLPMRIRLVHDCRRQLFCLSHIHWWLTGFLVGRCIPPSEMTAEYTITVPDMDMCGSFLTSLTELGYGWDEIELDGTTLHFIFSVPKSSESLLSPEWRQRFVLWKDRLLCRIYLRFTCPFSTTADRLLYLYYYLPFAFRRTICPRKFKKQKRIWKKYNSDRRSRR